MTSEEKPSLLCLSKETFSAWCDIKNNLRLPSHDDLAAFFIRHYHETSAQRSACCQCGAPISNLCPSCEGHSSKIIHTESNSETLTADGVKVEVKIETDWDAMQGTYKDQHAEGQLWKSQTTVFNPTDPQSSASSSTLPLASSEASPTGLDVKSLENQWIPTDCPSTSTSSLDEQQHSSVNSKDHKKHSNNRSVGMSGVGCECEGCSKTFLSPSHLAIHTLFHSGEKPHVCDVCNKTFRTPSKLAEHQLIHSGEKPHVCDVCNRAFRMAYSLKKHKLIHKSQKVQCDVCNKTFTVAAKLKQHKLRAHSSVKESSRHESSSSVTHAGYLLQMHPI